MTDELEQPFGVWWNGEDSPADDIRDVVAQAALKGFEEGFKYCKALASPALKKRIDEAMNYREFLAK